LENKNLAGIKHILAHYFKKSSVFEHFLANVLNLLDF